MTIIHMEEPDIITKKPKVPNKLFKGDGELQAFLTGRASHTASLSKLLQGKVQGSTSLTTKLNMPEVYQNAGDHTSCCHRTMPRQISHCLCKRNSTKHGTMVLPCPQYFTPCILIFFQQIEGQLKSCHFKQAEGSSRFKDCVGEIF
jgi:hypothetical protein